MNTISSVELEDLPGYTATDGRIKKIHISFSDNLRIICQISLLVR